MTQASDDTEAYEFKLNQFLDDAIGAIGNGLVFNAVAPRKRIAATVVLASENDNNGGNNFENVIHTQEDEWQEHFELDQTVAMQDLAEEQVRLEEELERAEQENERWMEGNRQERTEHDVTDIEDVLSNRKKVTEADKLVFFDLEWHTLDKKAPSESIGELKRREVLSAHICQIAAFTSNYSIRFNQYVSYRKLEQQWRDLVENVKLVDYSPQDDPAIAISPEDCLEQFVKLFHEDTLFLSYGSTDARAIFRFLLGKVEYDPTSKVTAIDAGRMQRRQAIFKSMKAKRWKWSDARHWIQAQGTELKKNKLVNLKFGGGLGTLYDTLFHRSLLVTVPTPTQPIPVILEALATTNEIANQLQQWPASLSSSSAYGLVPRRWLEVRHDRERNNHESLEFLHKNCFPEFWSTSHLEPVFHVAHTDAIMTINCIAFLAIVVELIQIDAEANGRLKSAKPDFERWITEEAKVVGDKDREAFKESFGEATTQIGSMTAFHAIATSVIAQTWFFRKDQIALSNDCAIGILKWYTNKKFVHTSKRFGPSTDDDDDEWEVEKIVETDWEDNVRWYKVRWLNFEADYDAWITRADLILTARETVEDYEKDKNLEIEPQIERQIEPPKKVNKQKVNKQKVKKPKLTVEQIDASSNVEFERAGRANRTYMLIPVKKLRSAAENKVQEETVQNNTESVALVQTQRNGQFSDKVKAIRDYIRAKCGMDPNETALKIQYGHQAIPFMSIRFKRDPTKSYHGKPWFSFPTSAAGPNTTMLHTQACRNLSDPRDRSQTRSFSEMNVMMWDFDKIALAGLEIHTKFRFCKECKRYTTTSDLQKSVDPRVNALIEQTRNMAIEPPPKRWSDEDMEAAIDALDGSMKKVRFEMPSSSQPQTPLDAVPVPKVAGRTSSKSSSGSSHTSITLSSLPPQRIPLTNIVSYLAVRRSHSKA